jgi:hypothetical protein
VSDRVKGILGNDGKLYCFGRIRPKTKPRWHFAKYRTAALPTPPASVDYSAAAASALSNIYLNDQLGDCVIAGGYHVVGVLTGNAGDEFVASTSQITADYSAIGGYVPGNPATDQGCDEQTALAYWTATGFQDGTKLAGWLAVDATNKATLMQALDLFENLYFGVELPDAWVNPMPQTAGFTWDVAGDPDPGYGHCVMGVGYNATGVQIDTWGMLGTITWAALAKYMVTSAGGEAYTLCSPDQIAKGQTKAPNGFDWSTLIADFNSLGGNLPVPNPPTPVVPPTPPVNPPAPASGSYAISGTFQGTITPS